MYILIVHNKYMSIYLWDDINARYDVYNVIFLRDRSKWRDRKLDSELNDKIISEKKKMNIFLPHK